MNFFDTLKASPPSTPLSRFIVGNGVLYMSLGAFLFFVPDAQQRWMNAPAFVGNEEALSRIVGFSVLVIGWFYVMGGRTRADSFGLATIADRLLVPVFLIPLMLLGKLEPMMAIPFSIFDPALAIVAFIIWKKSATRDETSSSS